VEVQVADQVAPGSAVGAGEHVDGATARWCCAAEDADLFFQLAAFRYGRASLIVTSNIAFGGARSSATTSSPPLSLPQVEKRARNLRFCVVDACP
jgi:hypothetical protein